MAQLLEGQALTVAKAFAAAISALLLTPGVASADYACDFVEVQCDRAANVVRVVPFSAVNEDCDRVRAIKDADWLLDVGRNVRATGNDRTGPGVPKVFKCEFDERKSFWTFARGIPINANLQGRCGPVFSAIVIIEEQRPRYRRVVNELNLLNDCAAGGAADSIEYHIESQKVLIQWTSEPYFGPLERTILTRKRLEDAKRDRQ